MTLKSNTKFRVTFTLLLMTVAGIFLWKISPPWQATEEEKKWQADKAAFAEYIDYVNDLRINFALQMQKELGLICTGDRGRMHGKIEAIGLSFNAYRRASIEEARALQLFVMNRLVQTVNAHDKLGPFLDERPITYKRVMVAISFEGPNGPYCDGSVAYISNVSELAVEENRNKIFYRSIDALTGNLQDLFEEHYEEAVQRAEASPIPILKVHQTTPLEEAIDEVLPRYAEEMRKKYRFECWGIGGTMSGQVDDIGVHFVLVKQTGQEEARKFIVVAAERLLQALNSNPKLRDYLGEYPFPSHRLKIRIGFKKRNYYSYADESMESVRLEGNEISYYKDPVEKELYQGPEVFEKESYQEAFEKIYRDATLMNSLDS